MKETPKSFDKALLEIAKNGGTSGLSLKPVETGKGEAKWKYPGVSLATEVYDYLTDSEVEELVVDSFNRELAIYWRQSEGNESKFGDLLKSRNEDKRGRAGSGSAYWQKKIKDLDKSQPDYKALVAEYLKQFKAARAAEDEALEALMLE